MKEIEKFDICFIAGSGLLSLLKQTRSRRLFISILCFCPTRRGTGKVSLLLWCGSCSFGTPLYAHLFSLNHSCKQVGSAFFPYRFWIEFKAPGNPSLLRWWISKQFSITQLGCTEGGLPVPCFVNGIPNASFLDSKTINHQVITFVESDSSISQTVLSYTFYPVLSSCNLPIYI